MDRGKAPVQSTAPNSKWLLIFLCAHARPCGGARTCREVGVVTHHQRGGAKLDRFTRGVEGSSVIKLIALGHLGQDLYVARCKETGSQQRNHWSHYILGSYAKLGSQDWASSWDQRRG